MKHGLLAGLLFGLVFPLSGLTEVVIYCDQGYYPYCWGENGKALGAYPDILQEAQKKLRGYQMTIVPAPWKRALADMEAGRSVAIFPTYKREELRPWMDYELPLSIESVGVLVKEGSRNRGNSWPQDYLGLRIGLNAGFVALDPWKDQLNITLAKDNEQALLMLWADRIDAYVNDFVVMDATIAVMKAKDKLPASARFLHGPTIFAENAYLSLTKVASKIYPYLADFRQQMNVILKALKQDGTIDSIMARYLKRP